MKRIVLLVLAAALLVPLVAARALSAPSQDTGAEKKAARVVEFVIKDPGEDPAADNPLGPSRRNFRGNLLLLRRVAGDESVAGVRLELKSSFDYARALDLLGALRHVKASGKKIVCYAENLSQSQLLFASLADVLVVPPSGLITLEGLVAEVMYLKDLLEKLDARMEVLHIGDFKTAFENVSRDSMSDEQRQTILHLLDEFYGQLVETIATNRGLSRGAVEALFEKVILSPHEAQAAGLIGEVGYEDQFKKSVESLLGSVEWVKKYGDEAKEDLEKLMSSPFAALQILPKLFKPEKKQPPSEPCIAVVYATGQIGSGKSRRGFSGEVSSMGSETIVKALEETLKNDRIKAVVFRVNSPGGSAVASDMIWRAVQRVREKKPVIASMGYVAASGGYWISMGCDKIVAQPSTITGSIGVVSAIPDLSRTLKRIGINVEVVGKGPHAEELALLRGGPSPFLKKTITDAMLRIYESFIEKVSAGRRMDPEKVRSLARGRVWTGREAVRNGLADQLGGLEDAIALACKTAGGLDPAAVPILEYPEAPNFIEQIQEIFEEMTLARTHLRWILSELPPGVAGPRAAARLSSPRALDADRIQCILPFRLVIR
jgi:protease-4